MKQPIIILISLLTAQWLAAQMTLDDCLRYARDHAHSNRLERVATERADIDTRLAAAPLMPEVALSGSGNMSFGRNIDPETNTYDNKRTLASGFGLQMSLPLFDGLVDINRLKAARTASRRQRQLQQAEQDRVSLEVVRRFYEISYCKALVRQMEEQFTRDSTDLAATRRGERLGTKSGADVAEIEALVANDIYQLTFQRNQLRKAGLSLRAAMGMPLDTVPPATVELSAERSAAPLATVNPRVAAADLALRESRYQLRAARGQFAPRISLNGGISTSYYHMMGGGSPTPGFGRQWHDNMGQYAGVTVAIPIFTGLSTLNGVKRARINLAEREIELERTRYEVEKETTEAALDLMAATEEHEAALRQLDAAALSYAATRRKYELGSASAIDLYTASAKLAEARATLEGKRIQKAINTIVLSYYQGQPLITD